MPVITMRSFSKVHFTPSSWEAGRGLPACRKLTIFHSPRSGLAPSPARPAARADSPATTKVTNQRRMLPSPPDGISESAREFDDGDDDAREQREAAEYANDDQ